ncbi:MAG: hypothetical protein M3340_01730 [Actinomycetota bacterium]|nr:hypothetical protein [Actinomycetota bacterium]
MTLPLAVEPIETTEFNELLQRVDQVHELVRPALPHAESVSGAKQDESALERRAAWYQALENAVLDLSEALPRGAEDYEARKLFEFLIELRRAIDEDPDGEDRALGVELVTMQIADVIRRIERRLNATELDDPRRAADFVLGVLGEVKVTDVARLLGVTTKTIAAWKAGKPVSRNAERVILVAHLLDLLRSSMTPTGLVMWFDTRRAQLRGKTPRVMLDEDLPLARQRLTALARGTAAGQIAG